MKILLFQQSKTVKLKSFGLFSRWLPLREKEVHIQFAKDIRDLCNKNEASCKVLINSDVFIEDSPGLLKRIEERKKNWSTFLDSTAVPYAFANLDSLNVKRNLGRI